jgi:hypothetical protein
MKRKVLVIEQNDIHKPQDLIRHDLIERAKANDHERVQSMTGELIMSPYFNSQPIYLNTICFLYPYRIKVTEAIINEFIQFINTNLGKNKMEIMLCDQNTPTEVLDVVSYIRRLMTWQTYEKCTNLFLNNYFYFYIYKNIYNHSDPQEESQNFENMINNIKFLCGVIVNNFPQARIIQPVARFIRQHTNPQVIQELQPFLDLAVSVEQAKDNVAASKPKLG